MTAGTSTHLLHPGRLLGTMCWQDVAQQAVGTTVLAVPVGSTEQHGPHLPLSTDTDVAQALCARLASARPDILVAPALAYGASGEHEAFPGTVSIGHEALEAVLVELCRSATRSVSGVVLVCAHGGNAPTLARAVRRMQGEGRRVLGWMAQWTGDAHAGRTETSLMLHLAPACVALHQARAGSVAPLAELMPSLRAGQLRALSPSGVLGDPSGASAGEGAALLDRLLDTLARAVTAWREAWADTADTETPSCGASPGRPLGSRER